MTLQPVQSRWQATSLRVVDTDWLHSLGPSRGRWLSPRRGALIHLGDFFDKGGGHELEVCWAAPWMANTRLPASGLPCDN